MPAENKVGSDTSVKQQVVNTNAGERCPDSLRFSRAPAMKVCCASGTRQSAKQSYDPLVDMDCGGNREMKMSEKLTAILLCALGIVICACAPGSAPGVSAPAIDTPSAPTKELPVSATPPPRDLVIQTFMFGSSQDHFSKPTGLAIAPDGTWFVADAGNNRILHLASSGGSNRLVLASWGTASNVGKDQKAPPGTLNEPWGIAIGADGHLFVADTWNHRIQKFTLDGKFVAEWGEFGAGAEPYKFWGPRGVAIDSKGRVFVTDTGNKRVVVYDADGKYLSQIGGAGNAPGQFDEPVGIAVDQDGIVYVADTWNRRVQTFQVDANGNLTPKNSWQVAGWDSKSTENKPFIIKTMGHILVTDPENYRVLEFNSQGEALKSYNVSSTSYCTGNFAPGIVTGIAVEPTGGFWVSDIKNNELIHVLAQSACTSAPTPASPSADQPASKPPARSVGQMVFTSNEDDPFDFEIYKINADGTGLTDLTKNPARDMNPAWSSDKGKIAFTSDRDGKPDIYVMNADGTGVTRLTNDGVLKRYLAWSPDGKWISFLTFDNGKGDVFIVRPDGSGLTKLTSQPALSSPCYWSPDGKRILFHSSREGSPQVYVMNADGSGVTRLTNTQAVDAPAGWSPDGKRILFFSNRDADWQIYVMNADGSGQTRLTDTGSNMDPVWSPDGKKVAFASRRDGHRQLYVMNSDGSGQTNISNSAADDNWFYWSPDNTQIYVSSALGSDPNNLKWSAAIINVDGSGRKPFQFGGDITWRP